MNVPDQFNSAVGVGQEYASMFGEQPTGIGEFNATKYWSSRVSTAMNSTQPGHAERYGIDLGYALFSPSGIKIVTRS